ncbi:dihydrofolate reductase [Salinarimonas soli]|uniref:Dihydrofolate reductase n=1 Tax=Salinarimonas soli TaxID=1638099 RepID=A0A5B2VV82_9HYPH|nr:dihydrofolate reductase [Salinarimonas soli]KAA2242222.1 dihydrofolate reductase [Salinarimonas soli]
MSRPLAIVVAVAENGVIGRDNGLAWHQRADLKRFRALTLGKPIVMGRKTYASIGKPLPGRETVVLTRDPAFAAPGVHVAHDLPGAMRLADEIAGRMGADEIPVVGGAELYRAALPLADRLHLTLVHAEPEGDVSFPDYDPADFVETWRESHPAGPHDDHPFTFIDLRRRRPAASC